MPTVLLVCYHSKTTEGLLKYFVGFCKAFQEKKSMNSTENAGKCFSTCTHSDKSQETQKSFSRWRSFITTIKRKERLTNDNR